MQVRQTVGWGGGGGLEERGQTEKEGGELEGGQTEKEGGELEGG